MTVAALRGVIDGAPELTPDPDDYQAEIARLVRLHPIERDREREAAAARLRCRIGTLDKAIAEALGEGKPTSGGRHLTVEAPALHPDPVDGAELLADVAAVFRRFLALPKHADVAFALWVAHTHAFEASPITPRLAITSPEKRCGKTTALEIVGALAAKPRMASNITSAATFRLIELARPTLLIDEADTFLAEAEELRGVLNSGHRRTGEVIRAEERSGEIVPVCFSTWAPVAIAIIGKLPGTLEDRSLQVRMSRRAKGELVERWRCDRLDRFAPLARRAARWAADNLAELAEAEPSVPAALHDRAADNWRPLLAIADAAGGAWAERARGAALALSGGDDADSHATMLLEDVRALFAERGDPERLLSQTIVAGLARMEHRPWPEISAGKPITPRKLAGFLARFGVAPGHKEDGNGYQRESFREAWERYLPGVPEDGTFVPSGSQRTRGSKALHEPSGEVRRNGTAEPSAQTRARGNDGALKG